MIIVAIKAIVYNSQDNDEPDKYSAGEILFCVLHALRIFFNAWILILFLKQITIYRKQVKGAVPRNHIKKTNFVAIYVATIMIINMCFYHLVLPYYYILLLHAETP